MSRRAQIAMDDGEVAAFLEESRTLACATIGRDGWPHVMPLWYVVREREAGAGTAPDIWAWTYAASQKSRNLQRDPRATLQVEAGATYDQLRGVMIKAEAVVHRDPETVAALGVEIMMRNAPGVGSEPPQELRAAVAAQAPKRIAMQFVSVSVASFDHRKLGGVY